MDRGKIYSPWGHKEWDRTEQLIQTHTHTHTHTRGNETKGTRAGQGLKSPGQIPALPLVGGVTVLNPFLIGSPLPYCVISHLDDPAVRLVSLV